MPQVKLFAGLRKLAGTKELSITETSVGGVLGLLVGQYPQLGAAILEDGVPRSHVIITLNGHNVTDPGAMVGEQDVIAIFPPIAGGTSPLP